MDNRSRAYAAAVFIHLPPRLYYIAALWKGKCFFPLPYGISPPFQSCMGNIWPKTQGREILPFATEIS